MTEHPDQSTVLDRMLAAGINPERAHAHLRSGLVRVDGETVTDPGAPAPVGTGVVIAGRLTPP
jgi:hypothetical protein